MSESTTPVRDAEAHRAIMAALRPNERLPYRIGARLNETLLGKRAGMFWTRVGARPALHQFIKHRLELRGQENLPRRSFILACNHRTFFDLHAVTIAFWPLYEQTPFLYCPVRSNFFYERPLGVFINLLMSGNAMYPPIFRDDRGPALNRLAIDACKRVLDWSPRTIVAIHPEGTRNGGDSPYEYLPAKPGIGYIALHSGAPIVPAFVAGLPRKFGQFTKDRFRKDAERIRVWIGPALDYDDLRGDGGENGEGLKARAHAVAERTMDAIRALGEQDRGYVESLR